MLAGFRAFAKSWVAKVLFGVLALAFLGWGVQSQTGMVGRGGGDVIRAGSHRVNGDGYKRIITNQLQRVSQQQGRTVTPQEMVQAGVDQDLLRQLGQATSVWELVHRMGIQPSATLVARELGKIPQLMDEVSHRFSQDKYTRLLRENGYVTKADQKLFETQISDDLAETQFTSGLMAGLTPPKTYGAVLASQFVQQRDGAYFGINTSSITPVGAPTDAQLGELAKELGPRLQRPETRTISLVRISLAALTPIMPVNAAEVQKAYDARKAGLSTPEKRAFVQINLRSPADAQVLAARLARGEDAAAAAKGIGAQAITFPDTDKGAVPDPSVAQAVFALQPNQTSQPFKSIAGLSIVHLTHIAPAAVKGLDQARGDIEQEIRQEAARQKVFDAVRKYNDARDAGADMAKAAQAAQVKVYSIGPITAQGQDATGRPNPSLTQPMLKDAFSKPAGGETSLIDMGASEYYAVKVDKVDPSAAPPMAAIRPLLARLWVQRETGRRLKERADGLVAQIKAGKSIDAVASGANAQVQRVSNVTQLTAQQYKPLGGALIGGLFGQKPNGVFTAPAPDGQTLFIAQLTAVRAGDPGNTAALGTMANGQAAQGIQGEVRQFVLTAAQARIKPKIDRNKGLVALGVDPKSVPASGTPAASGAPSGGGAGLAH